MQSTVDMMSTKTTHIQAVDSDVSENLGDRLSRSGALKSPSATVLSKKCPSCIFI